MLNPSFTHSKLTHSLIKKNTVTKYTYTEKKDTRSGFGAGLLEAGKRDPKVVALCADLVGSLKMQDFINAFPERFVQVGIAEAT